MGPAVRGGRQVGQGQRTAVAAAPSVLPVLQATQNRDGAALQAKLDELITVNKEARNDLIGIEDLDEERIEQLRPVPGSVTDPHPGTVD